MAIVEHQIHPSHRRFSEWLREWCDVNSTSAKALHQAYIREGGTVDLKTVRRWLVGEGGGPRGEEERLVVAALLMLVPNPAEVRKSYLAFVQECLDARPLWLSQTGWASLSEGEVTSTAGSKDFPGSLIPVAA